MKTWSITEARATISKVFDAALSSGPQRIERRESEPVIMVAEKDWKRLSAGYDRFADVVLDAPFEADDLPPRRPARIVGGEAD